MAKLRTHYDNLKVARNAPDSVIKAAYKALCQQYHPDKFQGSKEEADRIIKLINASYAVLLDLEKRANHDRWIDQQEAKTNQQNENETIEATKKYQNKQDNNEIHNESSGYFWPWVFVFGSFLFVWWVIGKINLSIPESENTSQGISAPVQNSLHESTSGEPYDKRSIDEPSHQNGNQTKRLVGMLNKPTLADLRKELPEYEGISDDFMFNDLHKNYFSNVPRVKLAEAIGYELPDKPLSSDNEDKTKTIEQPATALNHPEQPLPKTGTNNANFSDGVAPLKIRTSSDGGYHYFVKIVNLSNNQSIGSYFIRSGESINIKVPLGTYQIRYAYGTRWQGINYLFGSETTYSKAESTFNFSFDGYQYTGYTVELIIQQNGNLETSRISPNQF